MVLSIAGLDPSNGAGLTADLKTFEANGVYGLSVCTAITVQNEHEFVGLEWVKCNLILQQIDILVSNYSVRFVKIGIVENLKVLVRIINHLHEKNPTIKIIWDPILKASSGFSFHSNLKEESLIEVIKSCYLITPNQIEWDQLFAPLQKKIPLEEMCNIFLKGGHSDGEYSIDTLLEQGVETQYKAIRLPYTKHGTGCVLSAAITANLENGKSLKESCDLAKQYVTKFIDSNNTMLGDHHYGTN